MLSPRENIVAFLLLLEDMSKESQDITCREPIMQQKWGNDCNTLLQTEVLTTVFSLGHGEFLSSWCSSELPVWEEDDSLEYDPWAAASCTSHFASPSKHPTWFNSQLLS